MRISYEWLGDFVDLEGVTPKEAAEVLTRLGVEIESMTVIDLSEIVIGGGTLAILVFWPRFTVRVPAPLVALTGPSTYQA